MGLDGVELVLAIEEEFGLELSDSEVENIVTVGDFYNLLKTRLQSTPPIVCSNQKIFCRVRKALMENFGLSRSSVKVDTKLIEILPAAEIKEAWPYLDLFSELRFPEFEVPKFFFSKIRCDELTIREIVTAMATLNAEKVSPESGSDEEIWLRLATVIQRQINVNIIEIQPNARIVRDLGVD